ncbi:MFS transporter [Actinokineospora sp. G85]|uniref:MFS transporter n=1 Tax=Actinokineospora sp. G85 TaxID=3406626 RepID=UPI003C70AFCB
MVERSLEKNQERRVISNVIRGSVGNLIEWYDWYAYTAFSIYFSSVFFPAGDQTAQLLNTAGIFAVGFLMRPLGGWLMGQYADRHGRRAALTLSVLMMGFGSLIIALTPGYATIGVAAPVMLLLARLLQGLSVGGEYATSATYLSEVATSTRRGYYSSFQYVTLTAGQLVALGVQIVLQQVLTAEQMGDWGWRIAFVVGAVGAVTVMYLRSTMDESTSYLAAAKDGGAERGTLRVLLRYPKECLLVCGLTLGGTVAFYTYTTYLKNFMVNTSGIDKSTAAWINFAALLVFVVIQPLAGGLSDRIGRRPLLMFFGVGATVLTVPLMTLLSTTSAPVPAFLIMMAALVVVTGYTSVNAIVKAELFPVRIRALGVGLPYALTVAVFGGTAEYIGLWLKRAGVESLFFYYVAGCALVSLLVYWSMRETLRESALSADAGTAER